MAFFLYWVSFIFISVMFCSNSRLNLDIPFAQFLSKPVFVLQSFPMNLRIHWNQLQNKVVGGVVEIVSCNDNGQIHLAVDSHRELKFGASLVQFVGIKFIENLVSVGQVEGEVVMKHHPLLVND